MNFARQMPLSLVLFGACASTLVLGGCHHSPKHYEADVQVTRVASIRKDETGKTLTVDFEINYVDCPGTQIEVFRGDASFAACVSKYKVGDRVRVGLDHQWSSQADHYESVVKRVGDCARTRDPNDEASYALVRECDDWLVNGTRVGFTCNYVPEKKLLAKCPWFRRH